jgi:hypothetical protein
MKSFYILFSPEGDAPAGGGDSSPSGDGGGSGATDTPAAPETTPPSTGTPQKSYLGHDGKFNADFAKDHPELAKKHQDLDGLLKSHVNQGKLIGAKGIVHPGPNATPEQKAEFYRQLGRPDKAEMYGFDKIDKIKVNGGEVTVPAEFKGEFSKMVSDAMHEEGLSTDQAKRLMEKFLGYSIDKKTAFEKSVKETGENGYKALEKLWGDRNGAQFKENASFAYEAALKLGISPEEMEGNPQIANDPIFLRSLAKYGATLKEKSAAGARGDSFNGKVDPGAERDAIMADKNNIFWPNSRAAKEDPKGHAEQKAYVRSLSEKKIAQRGGS